MPLPAHVSRSPAPRSATGPAERTCAASPLRRTERPAAALVEPYVNDPAGDLQRLSPTAREALRIQAITALDKGRSGAEVAERLALPTGHLTAWWDAWQEVHRTQLAVGRRTRPPGERARILPGEQQALRRALLDHSPASLGLGTVLWSRPAVAELAAHMYRVTLSQKTVAAHLRSWGLVFPPPHHGTALGHWRRSILPGIRATASAQRACVLYAQHITTPLHPVLKRPGRAAPPSRNPTVTALAAQNAGRELWFALYSRKYTAPVLLDFLERLTRQFPGRIHLVVAPHTVQPCKKVHAWLTRHAPRITLHQLPAPTAGHGDRTGAR